MLKQFLSLATVMTAIFAALPASGELILPGRCHMGICWDQKFLGKALIDQSANGKLYEVELAFRSWPMESEPPNTFETPDTSYVFCSTDRPAYIFESDGTYFAHLLNPGGDWYGYNVSDYPVYWATCHNFVGPNFFSEEMTNRAIQLGYSLDLPSDQIELTNVRDIMN
ncbi:MAG: hypothetical protein F6J95_016895 [Leptolyngbya sp. SIO1E4]|nr:hypothetical protein [Leptolyngbya sp. SIO1E4]